MLRTAGRLEDAYAQVRRAVRGSPQVDGDETGWRVDGRGAWLHAFVGLTATCYEVDATRSIGPAERLLGIDWSGIFGHDGWAVYDKFTAATHQQCFAYLLRRCESLIESGTGGALAFPRGVKDLLLAGFEYRNRFRQNQMTAHGMKVMAGRLTMQMWELTRLPKTLAANERFAKFLKKHLGELFTFLRHPGADDRDRGPVGLGLDFQAAENGDVQAAFECQPLLEGYPSMLHSGIVCMLLDGAMTNSLFARGVVAVTVDISVKFRKPISSQGMALLRARVDDSTSNLFFTSAELLQEGEVKATAKARFTPKPREDPSDEKGIGS